MIKRFAAMFCQGESDGSYLNGLSCWVEMRH